MQVNLLDNDYLKNLVGPTTEARTQEPNAIKARELALREEYYRKRSNAEANAYFDKIPEGVDIAKVQPAFKPEIMKWNQKNMYKIFQYKKMIKETEAGSEQNLMARQKVQELMSNAQNLNNQLTNLKSYKTDYLKTESSGNMSNANDGFKLDLLSNVYNDKMNMKIDNSGNLFFINENGYAKFNDLHDYTVVDTVAANEILNMNEAIYKAGQPMSRHTANLYRIKLTKMVANLETAKSLAADDLIIPGGLGVDRDLLHNPERADELREFVINSYMQSFEDVANEAAAIQRQKTRTKGGGSSRSKGGTASSRKYNARMNNMYAGFDALKQGNTDLLNMYLTGNDEVMESKEEPGMYEYFNGDTMYLLDPNDPTDIYSLLKGQNIPDDMWPDFNKVSGNNEEQPDNEVSEEALALINKYKQ